MGRSMVPRIGRLLATLLIVAAASAAVPAAGSDRVAFAVSLATDRPVYARGEPIRIVFEVANHTAAPVTLDFASAQRFDLAIADESGAEVWRWSAGRMFAQMLGQEVLGPETGRLSYEAIFAGALGPGRYRIEARLTDRSGDFSASLGVEVK